MRPLIPDIKRACTLIPPLTQSMHKGQAGRVGVVGGSEDYTGAPYFSAMAALRLGADLCHVFCEPEAGTVIKSYSPDLIVHPYMRTSEKLNSGKESVENIVNKVADVLSRLHVLVIGPGLSRDKCMLETAKALIYQAREREMSIVVDADGLFLVQNHPEVIQGYKKAVLTPNVVEFKRLCKAVNIDPDGCPEQELAQQLSQALGGVTIVQKGATDLIANRDTVWQTQSEGGLKRMGGQGDILSGSIATFLAWGKAYEENVWDHPQDICSKDIPMYAAWLGCEVTRKSSCSAYKAYGRSVLTSHVLEEIAASYDKMIEMSN